MNRLHTHHASLSFISSTRTIGIRETRADSNVLFVLAGLAPSLKLALAMPLVSPDLFGDAQRHGCVNQKAD
jgi:hypothetical protein